MSDQSGGEPSYATPPAESIARVLRLRGQDVTFTRHLPRRGSPSTASSCSGLATAPYVLFLDDGILPTGAIHLESPTTVPNRDVEVIEAVDEFR